MQRRTFGKWLFAICAGILAYVAIGFALAGDKERVEVWKESVPLIVALAAAGLATIWQRRQLFQQCLLTTYKDLVPVIRSAIEFVDKPSRTEEEYRAVRGQVSRANDFLRGFLKPGKVKRFGQEEFLIYSPVEDLVALLDTVRANQLTESAHQSAKDAVRGLAAEVRGAMSWDLDTGYLWPGGDFWKKDTVDPRSKIEEVRESLAPVQMNGSIDLGLEHPQVAVEAEETKLSL